ncbi:MAG: outer membrane protein assembly factor BamB [Candidatus Paceibacteria bacterium]|jgi:outer membrane protein assembly factor BamB
MTKRSPLLLTIPLLAILLVGFLFRSRVDHFLAPVESDYTPSSVLSAEYPRPDANLAPVWAVELEPGYGGVAIDGQDVFVLDREAGVADTLRVLELATGDLKWSFSYPAPGRLDFAGSRTAPVVEDDLVYTCGSLGQVHCIDRRTHGAVWNRKLDGDCGGARPDFGWAASPVVHDGLVILPALGADVGLVAFDRYTGETRWQTAALGYSHSSPVVLQLLGESQLLFLSSIVQGQGAEGTAPLTVSAFDPSDGTPLWTFQVDGTSVPIPPPVQVDDDHFFLTGGYGGGSSLLHIKRRPDGYLLEETFHIAKGAQLHPPVVHAGLIYLVANENSNDSRRFRQEGGLSCFNLEGEELWSTGDDPYFGRGHLLLLGDHILIQDGYSGILRMCLANPEGYHQVATANVFESPPKARKQMWAPMARVGGTFVVRGQTQLRCVKLSSIGTRR